MRLEIVVKQMKRSIKRAFLDLKNKFYCQGWRKWVWSVCSCTSSFFGCLHGKRQSFGLDIIGLFTYLQTHLFRPSTGPGSEFSRDKMRFSKGALEAEIASRVDMSSSYKMVVASNKNSSLISFHSDAPMI